MYPYTYIQYLHAHESLYHRLPRYIEIGTEAAWSKAHKCVAKKVDRCWFGVGVREATATCGHSNFLWQWSHNQKYPFKNVLTREIRPYYWTAFIHKHTTRRHIQKTLYKLWVKAAFVMKVENIGFMYNTSKRDPIENLVIDFLQITWLSISLNTKLPHTSGVNSSQFYRCRVRPDSQPFVFIHRTDGKVIDTVALYLSQRARHW